MAGRPTATAQGTDTRDALGETVAGAPSGAGSQTEFAPQPAHLFGQNCEAESHSVIADTSCSQQDWVLPICPCVHLPAHLPTPCGVAALRHVHGRCSSHCIQVLVTSDARQQAPCGRRWPPARPAEGGARRQAENIGHVGRSDDVRPLDAGGLASHHLAAHMRNGDVMVTTNGVPWTGRGESNAGSCGPTRASVACRAGRAALVADRATPSCADRTWMRSDGLRNPELRLRRVAAVRRPRRRGSETGASPCSRDQREVRRLLGFGIGDKGCDGPVEPHRVLGLRPFSRRR